MLPRYTPQLYPAKKGIFLHNLYEHINTLNSVYQIVCGDFNCVLDTERGIISADQHTARDVNKFNDFVLKSELNDVWRLFNAEQKENTWSRKNPFTARRLDYILSTDTILNNICLLYTSPSPRDRHASRMPSSA